VITLTEAERCELRELVARGSKVKKAQVLLAADGGASDEEIAQLVVVGSSTGTRASRPRPCGDTCTRRMLCARADTTGTGALCAQFIFGQR
jgi:hypothetical protein